MSDEPSPQPPESAHPTRVVLRNRNLRRFVASRFCSATASRLLAATVAWHVYDLTDSAFHLGLVGLVQFVPALPFMLVGGAVADALDRRRIVLVSQAVAGACGLGLALVAGSDQVLALVYAAVFVYAVAGGFEHPARTSMLPGLVPASQFPTAVTVHSTFNNLAWVTGPVVAGFAIDAGGVALAYSTSAALVCGSLGALALVRARPSAERRVVDLESIREGLAFVWKRQAILGCMALDMFAVIFASVAALLPIFAEDVLQVGARGYGLLSAGLELGTVLMAVVLLALPPIQRPGRALLLAVGVYGAATILFSLSTWFPLSLLALVLAGMADQISMVTRSTIVQLSTPDALRGRVSSVNAVFISASNHVGTVESGFLAALTGAPLAALLGGVGCLGVLGWVAWRMPGLRNYRPPTASEPRRGA
ncbi:MAG: MFS transporter [Proteobacteria bacterium]|nr:MFS transporter [Pseudomonadota bacterium]